MKKGMLVICLLMILSACSMGNDNMKDTNLRIAGDTIYFRYYGAGNNECLDEQLVEVEPMNPELIPIFKYGDEYIYQLSFYQTHSNCESNGYVKHEGEYITLYDAFLQEIYTVEDYLDTFDNWDFAYISTLSPDELTGDNFEAREYISPRGELIYDAKYTRYYANDYCEHGTDNGCVDNQEITYAHVASRLDSSIQIDYSKYDLDDDTVIAIYHAPASSEEGSTFSIFLERTGTGEYEYPNGTVWENSMRYYDTVIDTD